jgi:hypothetical protein
VPEEVFRVESRRRKIIALDADRRWVADSGCVSRLGSPILTLVTGLEVSRLLGAGNAAYLVCGNPPTYEKHYVGIFSSNLAQSMTYLRVIEWVACRFEYRLEPMNAPSHLDRVLPVGEGVPEGLIALERHRPYCNCLVASQEIVCSKKAVYSTGLRFRRSIDRPHSVDGTQCRGFEIWK